MQAIRNLALMTGAGVLLGGGAMLTMSRVASPPAATPATAAESDTRRADGAAEAVPELPSLEAAPLLADGMPSGPTPIVQPAPMVQTVPRADGSVDADGTPGFVPPVQTPTATEAGPGGDRAAPAILPAQPPTAPAASSSALDPKGFDPVPSR